MTVFETLHYDLPSTVVEHAAAHNVPSLQRLWVNCGLSLKALPLVACCTGLRSLRLQFAAHGPTPGEEPPEGGRLGPLSRLQHLTELDLGGVGLRCPQDLDLGPLAKLQRLTLGMAVAGQETLPSTLTKVGKCIGLLGCGVH